MISGLIAGYRNAAMRLSATRAFFVKAFAHRSFRKITVEFLTEVAVLVLVFPTLDTVIEKGQSKVTGPLVFGSVVITVVCLLVAGIISMRDRED